MKRIILLDELGVRGSSRTGRCDRIPDRHRGRLVFRLRLRSRQVRHPVPRLSAVLSLGTAGDGKPESGRPIRLSKLAEPMERIWLATNAEQRTRLRTRRQRRLDAIGYAALVVLMVMIILRYMPGF